MTFHLANKPALLLAAGGVALVAAWVWATWESGVPAPPAARAPGVAGVSSTPGGPQTPEYARLQEMADSTRANGARASGGSSVPTPPELRPLADAAPPAADPATGRPRRPPRPRPTRRIGWPPSSRGPCRIRPASSSSSASASSPHRPGWWRSRTSRASGSGRTPDSGPRHGRPRRAPPARATGGASSSPAISCSRCCRPPSTAMSRVRCGPRSWASGSRARSCSAACARSRRRWAAGRSGCW